MPTTYPWTDQDWPGVTVQGQVIYELHIGTFTEKGTFNAAMEELPRLARLGITLIEIMPINEFPGNFGWGYDGVILFSPTHLYGTPDEVKAFVNKAHSLGMGVILDVVYNHLGPEDNIMIEFSKDYLSKKFKTNWGKAINFDHPQSREFFLINAEYWIQEFHFDGLRVDATPCFFSTTKTHILADLTKVIKEAGGKRKTLVIGENEPQNIQLIRAYQEGGYGFDMLWNDDFHHSARVRLTGKREAYFTDYLGSPQEFISCLKYGFLYQGQYYDWQKKRRGTFSLNTPPHSLVIFLENHDQIANTGYGTRLHKKAQPDNYKAMTCLFLLSPNTPLIFQGQEFNSNQPFYYFADHSSYLTPLIKKGRQEELSQFPRLATKETLKILSNPGDPKTFIDSKLKEKEKNEHTQIYTFYKDLIHLRKTDSVFKKIQNIKIDGAILGNDSFLIRYFGEKEGDRLIIVNFGSDFIFNPSPEPLLVPGIDLEFKVLFSTESQKYGGEGTPPINIPYWKILGHSAIVLKTIPTKKKSLK